MVRKTVEEAIKKLRAAWTGREVRDRMADTIEAMNEEVTNTSSKQSILEETFNNLIINEGNSNAEVVAARVDQNGNSYDTLGKRMNNFDEHLDTIEIEKASRLETQNIQTQVNNLVLQAGNPDASSAEIIQARGNYSLLSNRLNSYDYLNNNIKKMEISKYNYGVVNGISTDIIEATNTTNLYDNKIVTVTTNVNVKDKTQSSLYCFYYIRYPYSEVRGKKIGIYLESKNDMNLTVNASFKKSMYSSDISFEIGKENINIVKNNSNSVEFSLLDTALLDELYKSAYGIDDFSTGFVYFMVCVGRYNSIGKHLKAYNDTELTINTSVYESSGNTVSDLIKIDKSVIELINKSRDYVSPIDFGAIGDGVNDDSDAVQNCINYCIKYNKKLKCDKAYIFNITKTIEFIGLDYELTTGDGLVNRTVKRIATEFDFCNSTFYPTGNIINDNSHKISYNNVSYPCVVYYFNSDNFSVNGVIKNLKIDCRKLAVIGFYAEQIRKTRLENIDVQGLKTLGFWLGFSSGCIFNNIVIKADVKGSTGLYVTSSDNHFIDIFMVDVSIPFDTLACMNYFTRVHPFILTPSFISGSRMFKCRSFDFDGTYKGSVTMILTDCYCDTFEFCFDISDRKDHRIISKGLTYINNTTIMDNFFKQNGTTGLYLVKTGRNVGYASKVKIMNSFMSGFVKDDIIHTYLSDTGEITLDEFSVASNINTEPPALI